MCVHEGHALAEDLQGGEKQLDTLSHERHCLIIFLADPGSGMAARLSLYRSEPMADGNLL